MKGFSAFLGMRKYKDWDHEISSWKYLTTYLLYQFPWSTQCLTLHLELPSRACWKSTAAEVRDSISAKADGKYPWKMPICSWQQFYWNISSVQSLSCVRLFATPWITARQASLSITNSQSSLKLMSIESVMPSSHFILCPPLLLPPIPPSIRVFSNESTLCMRWPKYWSFSFSIIPSKEHPGLISYRMDWLDLLAVQGTLKSLLQHHSSKASILQHSAFFIVQHLTSIHAYWKNHSLD